MPSQDSKQQHLRNSKRQFNAGYKSFTSKLKEFKNLLNGKGKILTDIKNPLPEQLGSLLDNLSGEFAQLASGAEAIISEQSGYSKTRRKKKQKQPQQQPLSEQEATPPNDKIVQQLSQLGYTDQYNLEALATNRLTRSWQYFKSMFYRDEINKQRVSLLRMCADLFWSLRDFQNETLTVSIDNTPNLIQSFQAARYTFSSVHNTVNRLEEIIEREKHKDMEHQKQELLKHVDNKETAGPYDTDEEQSMEPGPASQQNIQAPKPQQQASQTISPTATPSVRPTPKAIMDRLITEANALLRIGLGEPYASRLLELAKHFETSKTDQEKHAIRNRAQTIYKEMIGAIRGRLEDMYGKITQTHTLHQIIGDIIAGKRPIAEAEVETLMIVKEGHNMLTRFLKRQLTKLRPSNETVSLRLDISNSIDDAERVLKQMMNGLHKAIDIDTLQSSIKELKDILQNISKPLKVIVTMFEKDVYKDPEKRKRLRGRTQDVSGDPSIDMLLRRRIRNDLSRGVI